ncbi:MAG: hypothetical protein LW809_02390 [Vampirovibrionales bacterium]|jgi:hypothetical protein|nr:hypothetical protein [Vampirovibrionales bacterium]
MQPISSLASVSMSPSKSLATQRNGYVFEKGVKIDQPRRLKTLFEQKTSKIADKPIKKKLASIFAQAYKSSHFYLRLDEKNFTFNIGKFKYCFPYDDSILSRLNAVLKFRQPK